MRDIIGRLVNNTGVTWMGEVLARGLVKCSGIIPQFFLANIGQALPFALSLLGVFAYTAFLDLTSNTVHGRYTILAGGGCCHARGAARNGGRHISGYGSQGRLHQQGWCNFLIRGRGIIDFARWRCDVRDGFTVVIW